MNIIILEQMLKLSDFDYNLPKELIARYPLKERDKARLLVLDRKTGKIEHRIFKDFIDYVKKDDLIVLNNTKVMRARLKGRRQDHGGKFEALLLRRKGESTFDALIKPSRLKPGEKIIFNGGKILGKITAKNEITFNTKDIESIYNLGMMPLPPYIKRTPLELDNDYYQTVYAKQEGAIASPTAGLHFTKDLIRNLEAKGANIAYVTLHIGSGTFKPVRVSDITRHKMEPEYFEIQDQTLDLIEKAQKNKKPVFTVGSTSLRTLETYAAVGIKAGYTDLFIYPGYKFKIDHCLLTNFHLPRTTLFMLVCAFCAVGASASGGAGIELIKKAYQEAIDQKYRFYSYGDAMLIL